MASIRGYIAMSLDGYIAAADGSLDWLTRYDGLELGAFGYDRFVDGVRTVVMGRGTYDAIAGFDVGWPYGDRWAIVVTSSPIDEPVGPVQIWRDGVDGLVRHLRQLEDDDVWLVGGGRLQQAFIERGALDDLSLFIMPELLGGGARLFPPNGFGRSVKLIESATVAPGCVCLKYDFRSEG
ncbi:MAG: dihydrofolate reductase family protein [Pseudomonadota bacterium]